MNILVLSDVYPSNIDPICGAFLYNLVQDFSKVHNVCVIAPKKIHRIFKFKKKPYGNERCEVKRPLYLSLSAKKIFSLNTLKLTIFFKSKAINRVLNKLKFKPDIIYCHFLSSAYPILDYANIHNIPVVVASGESGYGFYDLLSVKNQKKFKEKISKFICVSNKNREELLMRGFNNSKMAVVPNAVDYDIFKPLSKAICKSKLNIDESNFVVGFVGFFIHRKGPERIIKALKILNDKKITLVCVGRGDSIKANDFTKIISPLANGLLPEIYNAFDVFVLPTLSEGHCNAIEEAKACCIPIISSRGTSVEEQVNDTFSILVDPLDITEIARAISKIKDDYSLQDKMYKELLNERGKNSLSDRADKITSIFESVLCK